MISARYRTLPSILFLHWNNGRPFFVLPRRRPICEVRTRSGWVVVNLN